jgi:hypothetical protein
MGDIVSNQIKIGATEQMSDIGFLASEEIIQTNDIMPLIHESLAQVRTKKTCAASD